MTHSLEELKSGQLIGLKRLKIATGLTEFPEEIISLSETLEVLDLSDNQLTTLPNSIVQLKHLQILFLSHNNFVEFPSILAKCPNLTMIGFKSNQIQKVPENAFSPLLRWLILTDNKIQKLPKSIGDVRLLQKCMLAGNLLEALPDEMSQCENLELLRISTNRLKEIPNWLFELPKLSWVAFGGNPVIDEIQSNNDLEAFEWNDFTIEEQLGEGASGVISKANWNSKHKDVAIKVFKGEVTSDGLPEDEMQICISAGTHENLIPILGKIKSHPNGRNGLIMKLISSSYVNLGNPPSLETCTRDTFNPGVTFSFEDVLKIAKSIASICAQLHSKGINHGDLYAHNILINKKADSLLGDFGAASFYDINSDLAPTIERIEVRAFGCLIEDVLSLVKEKEVNYNFKDQWLKLISDSVNPEVKRRPSFSRIVDILNGFQTQ